MAQYGKELSNLSYTNKDFNAVYSELLDLVQKISYKWDPTVSDESDPGVVLLKLAALMTDKLNYNIDKNILELFPLSVTQLNNARQIFDQCGYSMRYYQSAYVDISMALTKEPDITDESAEKMGLNKSDMDKPENVRVYHIPKFTMVSDSENNFVYTIIDDVDLTSNGETVQVGALQGVATEYTINGDRLITSENLDYNRRIYFTETDIAENGIFIKNSLFGHSSWVAVDNLMIQPLGTPCYKFGLSNDGSTCYIEFPTDIDGLIGDGLEITYLRTTGVEGNVGKKFISQFFSDPPVTRNLITGTNSFGSNFETIKLSNDNVYITNTFATTSGKNPETIEEAYLKYEKVKNTFNTLISIRDYSNYMISSGMVSNGFACDRTNDIQNSYDVLSVISGGVKTNTIVENDTQLQLLPNKEAPMTSNDYSQVYVSSPKMSAFDLKLYGLQYTPAPSTLSGYSESFRPVEMTMLDEINNTIYVQSSNKDTSTTDAFNSVKCVQHDFKLLDTDRLVMLKNKYPIVARIVPQYKITNIQEADMIAKIVGALQGELNSQKISFGEEISYDLIYDTISTSDPRIKALMLDNIEYETYAVYVHQDEKGNRVFEEFRIDSKSTPPYTYEKASRPLDVNGTYYTRDALTGEYIKATTTTSGVDYYERSANQYKVELWNKFRAEIYAKSVLAGSTQLFKDANQFVYSLKQSDFSVVEDVYSVDTEATIEVTSGEEFEVDTNENILFTCPNLIREGQYSTYIKRLYCLNNDVSKNEDYQLSEDEWIAFFWKESEDEDAPYVYKKYSGKSDIKPIICPSFTIKKDEQLEGKTGITTYVYDIEAQNWLGNNLEDGKHSCENITICAKSVESVWSEEQNDRVDVTTTKNIPLTDYIRGFSGSLYALTGSSQIETKEVNKIHINNKKNGTRSTFWILKNVESNSMTGERYCQLFHNVDYDEDSKKYVYTLKSGEYFMYTNSSKTSLQILGQGTKIETNIEPGQGETWRCAEISYEDLMSYGIPYITENNYWYTLGEKTDVYATEMQFYQLGPGTALKITSKIEGEGESLLLERKPKALKNYVIAYRTEGASDEILLSEKNTDELAWRVNTILNINCDKNNIQYLKPTHSVVLHNIDNEQIGEPLSSCCMVASDSLELTGGVDVSTQKYNYITGQYTPVSLATFQFEGIDEQVDYINLELTKDIKMESTSERQEIEFKLPVGDYILKTQNSEDLTNLLMEVIKTTSDGSTSTPLESIIGGDSRPYSSSGNHYINLSIDDPGATYKLAITATAPDDVFPMSIQILSPYRYNLEDYISGEPSLKDDVFNELAKLDYSLFDYTYQVAKEDLVSNPLDANEFSDQNHIYNKYTICMWDIKDTISITNKIK